MSTVRELYEGWSAFIEFGRPQPPDIELEKEELLYVQQVANGPAGMNAGVPDGLPKVQPLVRKRKRVDFEP